MLAILSCYVHKCKFILCSQERFLLNGESQPDTNTTWVVPITYTKMSSMDFNKTTPEVWLEQSEDNVAENLTDNEWFILNIQETGTDFNIHTLCFCVRVCVCVCVCMCACMHCAYAMDHF
jgi:hypothetical protein